ncbi:MAG: protein kinase domain-containing protein [Gemmatimonadales bacterium]
MRRLAEALAGRYWIERELGQGGMATVFLAEDQRHARKVAIKVLRPELAAVLGRERFLQEIQVTANLQHPHILPLFDSGEAHGFLYYVMPYVEGESLRERLTRAGPLPVSEALEILGDVAAALTAAHAQGIVHRDIKPENILIKDGEGLVADFGIALALSLAGRDRITATGLAVGTPAYMSPEQITGDRAIDGRTDTYALGSVLFETLTGQPPFTGPTPQAVIAGTLSRLPRQARSLRPDLPAQIDAALARALAKEPADRFATPKEFLAACGPPALPSRKRRPVVGVLVTLVLLAVVALPLWRSLQRARARTWLPRIAELAERGDYVAAYELAERAEGRIGGDTTLTRLFDVVADSLAITTQPAGARVYLQRLPLNGGLAQRDSTLLGTTPMKGVRVARADYHMSLHKAGYAPLQRILSSAFPRAEIAPEQGRTVPLGVELLPADSVPPGMVAVTGGPYELVSPDVPPGLRAELQPYWLDTYEVTNRQFVEFVRSGRYPGGFVDRTGMPGPRGWTSQEPPAGQDRHPVVGVSWFEAAAYCASVGKRLPTLYEWEKAARNGTVSHTGVIMPWGYTSSAIQTGQRANFSGSGTVPVDSLRFGLSPYGAYAMAGNVKEWLANRSGAGFVVAGGSWQDPAYLFSQLGSLSGATATPALGFRCARTVGGGSATGNQGGGPLTLAARTPVYHPVGAGGFAGLLSHYRYDRQPANVRGLTRVETPDWIRERFWLDGVAGDSILAYLYLPKRAQPPFQTIVHVPSNGTFFFWPVWQEVEQILGPHIKGGRAVLGVVLNGMIERPQPADVIRPPTSSVRFRDRMVLHATELRLGIDYVETRPDIDRERLAYVGLSWGAGSRLLFAALDQRFRSVVLIGAGIDERMQPTLPEAANFNFAPYIKPPKLFINGRHDEEHPWTTRALPLWNLLREPKELVLIDGAGHLPPPEVRVAPINAFLDKTLGPVKSREQ